MTFEQIFEKFMRLCSFKRKRPNYRKHNKVLALRFTLSHHDVDLARSYIFRENFMAAKLTVLCCDFPRNFHGSSFVCWRIKIDFDLVLSPIC